MSRPALHALAAATEAEAVARGLAATRLAVIHATESEAELAGALARGIRAGTVDRDSAAAEGLEAMARGLRAVGSATAVGLVADLRPIPPTTFLGRLRWLFTGE